MDSIQNKPAKAFTYEEQEILAQKINHIFAFLVLLFAYTFLPFRFWKSFSFSSQIEPLVIITTISLACCICLLIVQIRKLNNSISITLLDIVLFAYLLYLLLQLLFYSTDKEYIYKIVCLTAVYCVFRQISSQLIIILFYMLPVLVFVQIIYGYYHLTEPWQGLSDITGIFYNTGIFGGLVALGFVAGLGLILSTKPHKYYMDKILLGIVLILLAIQLIYSQSRAVWLATIAGAIVLLFPVFRRSAKNIIAVLISALLILGILFSIKLYHFKKDSADGRLLIWTVSWNLFIEKPLTGFGPDGFRKNYMLRQGDYLKEHLGSPWADLADDTTSPFNELLKTSVEQGIAGLLFVFGVVFITAKTQRVRREQAVLAALLVFACFSYPFSFIEFQILLVICLAGIAQEQEPVRVFRGLRVKPAMTVFVTVAGFSLYSLYGYQQAVKQWNNAAIILDDKTVPVLQSIYPVLKDNALFVSIYGSALYYKEHYSEAIPMLEEAMHIYPNSQTLLRLGESYEKTGNDAGAIEAWETASCLKPSLFAPHYNLAKLYFKQLDCKRTKEEANKVLTKKIKIKHPKIDWMKREMQVVLDCDSTIIK